MVDRFYLVQLNKREQRLRSRLFSNDCLDSSVVLTRSHLEKTVEELKRVFALLTAERIPEGGKNGFKQTEKEAES